MKTEWIDLTDINIERAIMSIVGTGAWKASDLCTAYTRAGFTVAVDHIFDYYLSNLVKKGCLKSRREGRDVFIGEPIFPILLFQE